MQFPTLLLAALFGTAALAAPSGAMGHGLAARLATRTQRQSQPLSRVGSAAGPVSVSGSNGNGNATSHVEYSSNWAGAVYEEPPSGTFTAVSATVTVPVPTATAAGTYSASAWVGIDGDTCGSAILQTGVDFTATKSGSKTSYSYDAWYEWYPDYAYDFSSFSVSAGDVIVMSVVSSSSTSGTATLDNLTTGKTVSKTLSSSSALCGENAEWIVEDFESNGELVAFADFGTVLFTGASAKTTTETVGTSDATLIDIKQGNSVLTSASIPSSSEVEVTYE
ncbi:aspergillopepsin-2 heavy chain [Diplodia corticola]|uniref:Aspergillopepsin-2 heavy chain n=1 Tax=Diplodia corticola TaxID=236234 RepID=A0A1J9SGA7_9PEZI|nr:aspergillopepsin-2 heavy chain [Diplodia corticola]OJD38844.1 aspergillopepsin-2 heavy chain [Diplodia corticola]